MTQLAIISDNSNTKLGHLIHSWSIPAGRHFSCPGESHLCQIRCYARRGFFRMPNVEASHERNYRFSRTPDFVDWITSAIHYRDVRIMRVHVAGDFYSPEYVQKWYQVVSQCRRQQFFAYTRSWRIPEMFPELVQLGRLPNFQLWWSIDRETGPAPLVRGIRRAYMAINDIDAENAPDDCDLVFRDQSSTVMKKANGIQVCPPENGVTTQPKITCSRCGICWKTKSPKWETLLPLITSEPGNKGYASLELNAPE